MIVMEDADLDSTVEGVVNAIYFNQGEVCIVICNMYNLRVRTVLINLTMTNLYMRRTLAERIF